MSRAAGIIILNVMGFALWQHAVNGYDSMLLAHAVAWSLVVAGFFLRDKEYCS